MSGEPVKGEALRVIGGGNQGRVGWYNLSNPLRNPQYVNILLDCAVDGVKKTRAKKKHRTNLSKRQNLL